MVLPVDTAQRRRHTDTRSKAGHQITNWIFSILSYGRV